MITIFISLILCCSQGIVGGSDVEQEPILWKAKGSSAVMNCTQYKGTTYNLMYWYKQRPGETMKLIVITNAYGEPEFGDVDKNKFDPEKSDPKEGSLTVKDLEPDDSAIYFCSASEDNYDPAYFGNGTKLTVLDPGVAIQKPDVRIINETSCKEKVTLVCLAENFYPDHVSIKWTLGSNEITEDVATDPYASQDKTSRRFSMSSRLKVLKREFTPKNTFTCTVTFTNATENSYDIPKTITGTGEGGYEPENYLHTSRMISLAYGVFIAKSALYGLVILVFVCIKGSPGKRIN